jgi:hypothetical protein
VELLECSEYLAVAFKSAEAAGTERRALKRKILGERQSLEDSRLSLARSSVTRPQTAGATALERSESR